MGLKGDAPGHSVVMTCGLVHANREDTTNPLLRHSEASCFGVGVIQPLPDRSVSIEMAVSSDPSATLSGSAVSALRPGNPSILRSANAVIHQYLNGFAHDPQLSVNVHYRF